MTIDGIPETLPPVSETAERSHFVVTDPRPTPARRRSVPALEEDVAIEDDTQESHVLDDLL